MSKSYKMVERVGTVSSVSDAYEEVSQLAEEMGEWCGNMQGTALESTEKYAAVEEASSSLENVQETADVPDAVGWPKCASAVDIAARAETGVRREPP